MTGTLKDRNEKEFGIGATLRGKHGGYLECVNINGDVGVFIYTPPTQTFKPSQESLSASMWVVENTDHDV